MKTLNNYIEYLRYILEHRKNVRKACDYWYEEWQRMFSYPYDDKDKRKLKMTLIKIKLTHDLSKFLPCEFIPYTKWFYGKYGTKYRVSKDEYGDIFHKKVKDDFSKAWEHHKIHNKHHWEYWTFDMEEYYRDMGELEHFKLSQPKDMPIKYIREMICDWTAMSYKFGDTPQEFYLNNYNKIELSKGTRHCLEINLGLLNYDAPLCEGNVEYWMTIKELKQYGCNLNSLLSPVCKKYNINFDNYDI